MKEKDFLNKIKTGDHVWIEESHNRKRIAKIDRLTATQFVIGNARFKRETGGQIGSNYKIVGIATPQDQEAYRLEQEERNRKNAEVIREREREEEHRHSLGDLFHNVRARVCTAEYNSGYNNGPFDLVFNNVDEDLIRQMAEVINAHPSTVKNNRP